MHDTATTPDDERRDAQVRRVILIEGMANAAILCIKAGVGLATGSLAILADAVHSLTDLANNVLAWFVIRLSGQPPDREHPYGHRKFETLAVFGLASLLTVLAVELMLHALRRPAADIEAGTPALLLMLGVLAVNVTIAAWERRWARRLQSDILHADASHTFGDVLTTVTVIAGWQLSALGYRWLDTVCTLGVSLFVLYLAFSLYRSAVPVLVDRISVDPDKLETTVREVDGVRAVRRVRSRWQGSERVVDMIVTVDPDLLTVDAHEIADAIEAQLGERHDITDVSIHIEPHDHSG